MKKLAILLLTGLLPMLGNAQSYPSPTYNNVLINGTASIPHAVITGGTITGLSSPLPVASGGTNSASSSGTALDNITGFSSTGFLTRTGAGAYSFQSLTNGITLGNLAQQPANTVLGNATGSSANITALTVTGCNGAAQALQWTNSSGFGCNSGIATSGANANITSLSGLTTPLSVGQGGTGVTSSTGTGSVVFSTSPTISSPTLNGTYAGSMTIPATSLTYTAGGTGAVSQTIANRFAQVAFIDSYGAVGNGTTDDSTPLVNAAASLGTAGGLVFLDCTKNYAILSNVTIPANVMVKQCAGGNPQGTALYTTPPSHINLSSSASITMSSNSAIDAVIIRSGLTIPVQTPSAYAGTAIKLATGDANDVRINALIIGFATCVDGTNGGDHQRWNVECDANPAAGVGAVIIGASNDTSYFKIRNWPWGTVAATSATNTRSGIGIQVLAGPNDDSRMELFDFGHAVGVDTRANGNVHYSHVWLDTNSTMGMYVYNNNQSKFDVLEAWTTPGVVFQSSSNPAIDYMYCNSNGVASASCIWTAAAVSPVIQISNLYVAQSSSYAINVGSTTARIVIGSAILTGINGVTGPYVVGPVGWLSNQVSIAKIAYTDLPGGNTLFGGNTQSLPSIASAALLAPPADYDHYLVTGTTTITNISGSWADRRLILTFAGVLTLTNNANIALTSGANMTTASGTTIALWYDQTGCACWREMWHH
ncbi:hypothetical protein KTE28_03585 [Burkholderia multivorans]|uniref:hypothetical protein n=1 Tax=Burkholderia multivorans TaxID=87883 RepID=UPI001C25FF3B|nr:hypothetical protein [Burkholderia multivorans]MBU9373414.1 hypothetical protein [Burkholderia multivorans]